ncbi:hypothetical protein NECAME_08386 [Necator americanus]|uniref:Uncharacterized protein n=1 Tax=Necator americanus TaxID=51031 RepID=W2TKE3_NECAM|nr:hypothetical protein NECAME_08386 [Necator americanus]ETN81641.1 hypothetical protein NECAME_08386 [Necator americanus]
MLWSRLAARGRFRCKTALKLDVSEVRPRGRPKIRWLDHVKLDMIDARLCTADAMDRTKWKTRSRKADLATTRTNAIKKKKKYGVKLSGNLKQTVAVIEAMLPFSSAVGLAVTSGNA